MTLSAFFSTFSILGGLGVPKACSDGKEGIEFKEGIDVEEEVEEGVKEGIEAKASIEVRDGIDAKLGG